MKSTATTTLNGSNTKTTATKASKEKNYCTNTDHNQAYVKWYMCCSRDLLTLTLKCTFFLVCVLCDWVNARIWVVCCVCVCAMFWLIHFNFACQCEFFAGAHPFFWCPHVRSTTVVPLFSPFTSIQANFDFINVMKQPYRVKRNQACHVQQQRRRRRRRSCLGIFSRYIRRFAASHFLPLLFASFLSVSIWCGVCCASLANVNLHKWTRFKIRILCFNKYKYY